MGGYAWVTLATNDSYSLGALVLAHSLRRVGTKYDLAVLVTPGVTEMMREKLAAVFSLVQEVNVLDSKDEANLALLARPELGITFTKLHCWRLTQYEKCVFVDADTLVVRNCDELFEREELSAAPDVGWPDCFNSGVFVFRPSQQTFASITAFAAAKGSFDGGDQGLLNMYFNDWAHKDISKHLPFIYNMCSTASYSYLPALKQFGDDVRIIHFIGATKPWLQYFDTVTGIVHPSGGADHLQPLLQLWWNVFCEKVHPQLSPTMAGLAGALAQMTLGAPRTAEQIAYEEHMRKQCWEQGQIDYMGRDRFDNIWKKICETLSLAPQRQQTPPKETTPPKESVEDKSKESTKSDAPVSSSTVKTDVPTAKMGSDSKQEQSLASQIPTQIATIEETCIKKSGSELSTQLIEKTDTDKLVTDTVDASTEGDAEQSADQHVSQQVVEQCLKESPIEPQSMKPIDTTSIETVSSEFLCKKEQISPKDATDKVQSIVSESIGSQIQEVPIPPVVPTSTDVCLAQKLECVKISDDQSCTKESKDDKCIRDMKKLEDQPQKCSTPETTKYEEQTTQKVESIAPESLVKSVPSEIPCPPIDTSTSPVPIQVAESVLQTEPKECVVEEPKLIHEEIASSIDVHAQGPATTTSEIIVEPKSDVQLQEPIVETSSNIPNGSSEVSEIVLAPEVAASTVAVKPQKSDEVSMQEKLAESFQSMCGISEKTDLQSSALVEQDITKLPESVQDITKLTDTKPEQCERKLPESVQDVTKLSETKPEQCERKSSEPVQDVTKLIETKSEQCERKLSEPVQDVTKLPQTKSEQCERKLPDSEQSVTKLAESEQSTTKLSEMVTQKEEILAKLPESEQEIKELPESESCVTKSSEPVQETPELSELKKDMTEPVKSEQQATQLPEPEGEKSQETAVLSELQESDVPVRPTRTKELNIPSTPIVTEPTPPTSPPIATSTQELESQGKTTKKPIKKVVKKSSQESESAEGVEGESGEKKTGKKVVKKTTKKPKDSQDESTESTGATEKSKKTVKTVKKVTKPAQTLSTDSSVPETPPPGASDVPIPPKRKVKPTTTTTKSTSAKKSDTEP